MNYTLNEQLNKALNLWLRTIWVMVFTMIILGGLTRLTNSGLSMVEWKAHLHFLPPLSAAEWERVFELYKSSPEFLKINFWMDLSDFKKIYLMEWFHRFWGQAIGLVFAIPLLIFSFIKSIPLQQKKRLWVLFAFGGLQGFLGWFMVKSGLNDNPHVSHFRLAIHLSAALILLSLISSEIWKFKQKETSNEDDVKLRAYLFALTGITILTMLWGAYTAGLKAGLIYNEFPLMGDHFYPDELLVRGAGFKELFVQMTMDPASIQFTHRCLASLTLIMSLIVFFKKRDFLLSRAMNRSLNLYFFLLLLQICLGISVILLNVPISLALFHQANAIILFLFLLRAACLTKNCSANATNHKY